VSVVLITLALFAIGHGLLALSLAELSASRAGQRHLEARTAAESAIRRVLVLPGAAWMDSVAHGSDREAGAWSAGRAQAAARVWRLSREAWWLEGRGSVGPVTSRTARLAWALDPFARIAALDAAVSVRAGASVLIEGVVDPAAPASVAPPLQPGDCDPWLPELVVHYGSNPLGAVGVLADGDTVPRLGELELEELLAEATIRPAGSGTPAPTERGGTCAETDPWSGGDPERPWRACGGHFALRSANGDLEVLGGSGQGILVVDGSLTLGAGARFYGLALVRGTLRVEGGARLEGLAVATGGVHVGPRSEVRGSACWVARALASRRSDLGRLRLVPGVGSLGGF
jgi:hypothetical protein